MKSTAIRAVPSRSARRTGLVLVGALAVGTALSGCSFTSAAQTNIAYQPGDGVQADLQDPATGSDVKFLAFLIVASAQGQPGTLLGTVANEGLQPVTVTIGVPASADGSQPASAVTQVTVPARGTTRIGPDGVHATIPSVGVPVGLTVTLQASVASGAAVSFPAPVFPPENYYAGITPSATSTPSPSTPLAPSATASPTTSTSPAPSASATSSTPGATPTTTP